MKYLKLLAIFIFDIIDKFYHQKRIISFLKIINIKIEYFIDIGSHKGTYTDLIIKNFKKCKVIMFEPQNNIFYFIKKKYKNKKKIFIYNNAVSNKNKITTININHHDLTSSLCTFDEKNQYLKFKARLFNTTSKGMVFKEQKIKTIRLQNILAKKEYKNKVDLIKIDTEGHELEVLQGIGRNIMNIKYILIEFHRHKIYKNYKPKKIHNYLITKKFILVKKFSFPFTTWEDRIYKNKT